MKRVNGKVCLHRGLTLMELVIAMAMIGIIFAAILPQFVLIRNSWDVKQGTAEALQNGRVLMDHISRNLSKAVRITAVTEFSDTEGHIEYEDNDGNIMKYDYVDSGNRYVKFGPQPGTLSDLAGPVSSLTFTCYDACDLVHSLSPVTDTNDIRVIKVDATFTNSGSLGRDKTFTTWVYLRVNASSQVCWSDEDIGDVAAAGSASSASCVWTIDASGADIWNNTDEFHYVYQSLSGNGQIVARVVSMTNTNSWAKAGVMIRETLTGGSKHAMMVVTPGSGTAFQYRTSTSGSSTSVPVSGTGSSIHAPYWVKLIRAGNTFTGYHSPDGSAWTQIGSTSITMATNVYVGLAVTSHNDGVVCRAVIDNVSFSAITYETFNEAKTSSGTTLTINTPSTNTGDLLIAAVATDGDTSGSLVPVVTADWTAINVGAWSGQVTLGAWRKFSAGASEPATHQFRWTGARPAYGWIMRFTNHDPANPINAWSVGLGGQTNINPTSPAVTTSVSNCMILRLGAFDGSDVTALPEPGAPGLLNHTAITMDQVGSVLLQDGFETSLANWTTDWDRTTARRYSGLYSAHCGSIQNDLVSTNINTSSYSSFTIEFWYYVNNIDNSDDVYLQLYNGSTYVNDFEVGAQPEDNWYQYQTTITAAQYLRSNFRIRFDGAGIDNNEDLWIDDVLITAGGVSGGAGYVRQSAVGDSGTPTFALTASQEARMLTIAIAPNHDTRDDCCGNEILP